ncbi:hypothetical protein [Nocardia africana]|uniref:hypothetical protein n=1 Tax=Nocardia africana TaxID=134964 RepID=UPI0012F49D43|nr:hypothetical protein [Nocardia africana]MCC3313701.1 hypothetical protein [Nocardia africana]
MMLVAGTLVPVRDPRARPVLGVGAARAAIVGVFAAVAGLSPVRLLSTGHGAIYAVLIGSSSAALVLPILDALGLQGKPLLELTTQIAIADTGRW